MKKTLYWALTCLFVTANATVNAQSTTTANAFEQVGEVQASTLNFLGKTTPLRDLIIQPTISLKKRKKIKSNKPKEVPNFMGRKSGHTVKPDALPQGPDPVWQNNLTKNVVVPVEPTLEIEGMSSSNFGGTPPDPAGDVSQDHYIQMINGTRIQIFDKEGNSVVAPFSTNTLWSDVGNTGLGDPIILYDQAVDRWLITEFAVNGNVLLVAVSETSDPQGSYFAYSFTTPQFPDYPKYGIWNNAYVVTSNEGAVPFYVLEREKILAGEPNPGLQRFTIPSIPGGPGFQVATPADWDGITPPPAGAHPMILRINDDGWNQAPQDRIEVYSIEIDWDTPSNSSITSQNVITAPFDSEGCAVNGPGFACIPQPSGNGIDGIPWVIMNRVQYRNFGDYEAMVLNFMVDITGTSNEISGIRWMELRRLPGEDWEVYQEGTFAPDDGIHRFMGGIAMDGLGNIGMAYSVSGPETSPSLRFTGRQVSDPLGEMTIDEYEFGTGDGSISNIRFGDYSAMSIDPSDDRTFWYTGEYKRPGQSWGTRIVAFQVARDTNDIGPLEMLTPMSADDLTSNEAIEVIFKNFGVDTQSMFQVGYVINDGMAFTEDINVVLPPDSLYQHTFTQTADLATIGAYNFKIFTTLADDTNILNDTLRMQVEQFSRYDAGITNVEMSDPVCGDTVTIQLELTNFGTQTLTSVDINYQLNGATANTLEWTGSLEMDETTLVELTIFGFENGTNSIAAFTASPNGEADEVPANDQFSRAFEAFPENIIVDFWMRFDFEPEETSWRLLDSEGNTLYMGGPYIDASSLSTVTEQFCLHPDSCYTFRVIDLGFDGMGFVDGDYTLTAPNGEVLASLINPDFGISENNDFCASGMCTLVAEVDVTNDTGAGDGVVLITASNGTGDLMYSIDGGENYQSSNLFENITQGEYKVVVTDGNGCDVVLDIVVNLGTNTIDVANALNIEVFPNPTDGVFRINIATANALNHLPVSVLDVTGKRLFQTSMARYNGVLTGAFSLEAYPAGTYLVKFEDASINRMVSVVKK